MSKNKPVEPEALADTEQEQVIEPAKPAPESFFFPDPIPMSIEATSLEEAAKIYLEKEAVKTYQSKLEAQTNE